MRSIRRSLILSVLILLALSLTTISALVYQTTQQSLSEKKTSMEELLLAKHQERCRLKEKEVDDALLADARNLASLVKGKVRVIFRARSPFPFVGVLTGASSPFGYITYPMGTFMDVRGRDFMFWHGRSVSLQLHEVVLPVDKEVNIAQYFQINAKDDELRSESLWEDRLTFDPTEFDKKALVEWKFDDTALTSGVPLRRVIFKLSRFRVYFLPPPRFKHFLHLKKGKPTPKGKISSGEGHRGSGRSHPDSRPKPSRTTHMPPGFTIYIQAACRTEELEQTLARFDREYRQELAGLEQKAEHSLLCLRNRLYLINGLTFVAALVGGCLVVGWGLSPIHRLSEAVSRVSPKDFRLLLENRQLPVELRPIADRLNQTLALLERAFNREKQAAADISHELRTPVAAMLTPLDVALRKPRSIPEYREVLEECRFSGQQISQLVERMLALARLDAGADHLRLEEVDVAHLAEQCAAMVRPLAEARGLRLSIHTAGPTRINADPDKLREVLTNLLHTAIEYNNPEGRVRVSVEQVNGYLEMEVSDTGIGIAPEAQMHIFERFFRADSSRQADNLHAGIGLALVKGYVDLMGGSVTLESQLGLGSTFRIRLPSHQATTEKRDCDDGLLNN